MSKYDSLRLFLQKQSAPSLTLQFSEIERLVSLPTSAQQYEWWWANEDPDTTSHVQCVAWQRAGYTAHPDMQGAKVTFVRNADQNK